MDGAVPDSTRRTEMTHGFRCAYYHTDRQDLPLTFREQSHLPECDLRALATAEAKRAGLIGDQEHQVSEADFADRLVVGHMHDSKAL
jgi:hypothetical protein